MSQSPSRAVPPRGGGPWRLATEGSSRSCVVALLASLERSPKAAFVMLHTMYVIVSHDDYLQATYETFMSIYEVACCAIEIKVDKYVLDT